MQLQQSMDHYDSHLVSHKLTGQTELGQTLISTMGRVTRDKLLHSLPLPDDPVSFPQECHGILGSGHEAGSPTHSHNNMWVRDGLHIQQQGSGYTR